MSTTMPSINVAPSCLRSCESAHVSGKTVAQILSEQCAQHSNAAGIVIARLDARAGTWQYSVDDGVSWRDARTDLINRTGTMGLALDREARLRLLPRSGERYGAIHITLHAVQHSLKARNGSHSAYVPDPTDDNTLPIHLVLDLNAINGLPPEVHVPRQRNKRALSQAKAQKASPTSTPDQIAPDSF